MSRLKWNETGANKYETGVSKGVLYPLIHGEYQTGVAWSGLTNITETLGGSDPNPIYADDMKYLELRAAETLDLTIEAYQAPYAFGLCDGTVEYIPGVNVGQQPRRPFGLCFKTLIGNDVTEDLGYKLHLIYNATVAPSEKSYASINDSPEAVTFSWDASTTPTNMRFHKPASFIIVDSTKCLPRYLTELEDILYGTADTDPRLPTPNEVITILGGEASYFYIRDEGHLVYDGPRENVADFTMSIDSNGYLHCDEGENFEVYLNEFGFLFIEEVANGA